MQSDKLFYDKTYEFRYGNTSLLWLVVLLMLIYTGSGYIMTTQQLNLWSVVIMVATDFILGVATLKFINHSITDEWIHEVAWRKDINLSQVHTTIACVNYKGFNFNDLLGALFLFYLPIVAPLAPLLMLRMLWDNDHKPKVNKLFVVQTLLDYKNEGKLVKTNNKLIDDLRTQVIRYYR